MNIRLRKISLSNIRSFTNLTEVDLPVNSGLYHLMGQNRSDARLGSNGSGKSSLINTIAWTLFDKWPGGLTSPSIASWGAKKGSVFANVLLDVDGEDCQIVRSWNPNHCKINGDRCNPADIVNLVGMDFQSFQNSVLISQNSPMFLGLTSGDRASLVSSVLNLGAWESRRDFSAKIAKGLDKEISEIKEDISVLSGKLQALEDISYQQNIDEWEKEARRAKQTYESDRDSMRHNISNLSNSIDYLKRKKDSARIKAQDEKRRLNNAWEELRGSEKRLSNCSARLSNATKELNDIENRLKKLKRERKCYACGQSLSSHDHSNMIGKETGVYETTEDEIDDLEKSVSKMKQQCKTLSETVKRIDNAERDAANKVRDLSNDIRDKEDRLADERKRLKDLEDSRQSTKKNPWKKRESGRLRNISAAKLDRGNLKRDLREAEKESDHVSYWVKGFNQLRLDLIANAISVLESEANANLSHLGMGNWAIEISTDRETKSKTITKGFHVMIRSPNHSEALPLDVWSGGESQRLRLAITMGLSDMIQDYLGSHWGIEIYDEPCSWLSSDGIDDLLSALKERAIRKDKAIWVVDHRSLGSGAFDRRAVMIKDVGGSRLEWEV